uniref:adhesion domain-containing protein n=1 Tax=Pectobacterium versatile TaxID=2488639 RepID=UPI001CCE0A23
SMDPRITINQDQTKVKVGESISVTLKVTQSNGVIFPQPIPVSFSVISATNRQNGNWASNVLINGTPVSAYNGQTDANGELTVTLTEPDGKGVKTQLKAITDKGDSDSVEATFTVITSPDTDKANMWGHMPDNIVANGETIRRPVLVAEYPSADYSSELANEEWALMNYWEAIGYCALPSSASLVALYQANDPVGVNLGWPVDNKYRSSTMGSGTDDGHNNVSLSNGEVNTIGGDTVSYLYVGCKG